MRASLSSLIDALEAHTPPRQIWQKPFDFDPSHYKRLCNLKGAKPDGYDLVAYVHDLLYEKSPLQADLFRYLLPLCLEVWQKDLFQYNLSGYGNFIDHFWLALGRKKS